MSPIRPLALLAATVLVLLSGCSGPAPTTSLTIDFPGEAQDVTVQVPFDAAARPADAYYTSNGWPHTNYTAFDQVVAWAYATGTELSIDNFSFGPCLSRIAGLPEKPACQPGATAYWTFSVNGVDSNQGMHTATLRAGDAVKWTLSPA